jgi:hypothetical protein
MPGIIKAVSNEDSHADAIPPFPLEALPPVLAEITRAIAETTGTPLDICAPCVIATASACLGRGLIVESAPGRVTAPNLYVLLVKPSGAGGSVAYSFATAPLRGYQATALRQYDEVTKPRLERRRDTLKADYEDAIKARRKLKADGSDTSEKDKVLDELQVELAAVEMLYCPPFIVVDDGTQESLAPMLMRRGEVLAHFDSDANNTVGMILGERYGNGNHTNDSLHLKAYSGESCAIIRKGSARGGSTELFLKCPTLACLFVVTPDVARKLFGNDRMKTGGLLPRFLVVNSQAKPQPWGDSRKIETAISQRYEAAAFAMLNTIRGRVADDFTPLEMTAEAHDLFAAHFQKFCDGFASKPDFSAFEARHTENAMRLALVFHAWRALKFEPDASGGTVARCHALESPLNGETAQAALAVASWFEHQQAAILAPMREAGRDEKLEKVILWCERRHEWIVSARDLVGARIASTAEEADKLLLTWGQEGRAVREEVENKPGAGAKKTKPRYRISQRR